MQYVKSIYEKIKLIFMAGVPHNYMMPYNPEEIEPVDEFQAFKKDNLSINRVIFAMNNIPDIIHELLFKQKYYHITLKLQLGQPELTHNLDGIHEDFENEEISHIYIRINIIIHDNPMHHVNCVVIDRSKQFILLFEPQVEFKYNVIMIYELLNKYINMDYYRILLPIDIGYTNDNKLQGYDAYCQSYVILAYMLLIINKNVSPSDYSKMFNTVITLKNIGYLLYYVHLVLINNKYNIGSPQEIWTFPTNKLETIVNIITYYYNNSGKPLGNVGTPHNYIIKNDDEDDSIIVVNNI